MTNAIGYTRLSEDGLSIPKQKQKIKTYCNNHNLHLETIHDDGEYASGYDTDDRPEYRKLRERVENETIDAVVVRDTGRIGRDFDERMYFVLDCRQADIELHSTEHGQHDLSDPWAVLQETAQAAGDDVQKRKEIERSKQATQDRISRGCFHGKPPFGLTFADDKCHLKRHPQDWETLTAIVNQELDGTVRETAGQAGVSTATVSRVRNRGMEWYQNLLDEYGIS